MNNSTKWLFTPNIRLASGIENDDDIFASEELQTNILNSIQDGVSLLDRDLNIRFVNTYMQCWYPNPDEIIGKKCFVIYHGRNTPCDNCPTIRSLQEKTPVRGVVRYTLSGDQKGWQELIAVPIFDQNDEVLGVFEYVRDFTFQYKIEQELKDLMQRIENLENNNKAMAQLLQQRKEEREIFEETIIQNVDKFIKPSLEYIKTKANIDDVEMVKGLIEEIVYPITKKRPSKMEELSSRELQIATLIKEGKTSKEIAETLFITAKTVEYHRANIRKKLGLNKDNKRSNLRSYLITHL